MSLAAPQLGRSGLGRLGLEAARAWSWSWPPRLACACACARPGPRPSASLPAAPAVTSSGLRHAVELDRYSISSAIGGLIALRRMRDMSNRSANGHRVLARNSRHRSTSAAVRHIALVLTWAWSTRARAPLPVSWHPSTRPRGAQFPRVSVDTRVAHSRASYSLVGVALASPHYISKIVRIF